MDEVFLLLDRTVSLPGRQILYHRLRVLEPEDTVLAERTRQYAAIQAASAWAAAARKPLARLGGRKAAWLPALLMDGIPEGPRRSWLYYGFGLAPALCLAVSFWVPGFLFAAFAMAIPNLVINEIQGPRMTGYFPALSQLHSLLGASLEVAALPGAPDLPQVAFLRENLPVLKAIRKRLGALSVDRTRLPELVSALFHLRLRLSPPPGAEPIPQCHPTAGAERLPGGGHRGSPTAGRSAAPACRVTPRSADLVTAALDRGPGQPGLIFLDPPDPACPWRPGYGHRPRSDENH